MQYLVTKKARVWASVNGRISPDFPVAFVDKGKKVDGTKVSEFITSEAGSVDEAFIELNGGKYILARNTKALGKEFSSADGDVPLFKSAGKTIPLIIGIAGAGALVAYGVALARTEDKSRTKVAVIIGALIGAFVGTLASIQPVEKVLGADAKSNLIDEIDNNGVTPAMHLCYGGYWQGSLATGHCVFPSRPHAGA